MPGHGGTTTGHLGHDRRVDREHLLADDLLHGAQHDGVGGDDPVDRIPGPYVVGPAPQTCPVGSPAVQELALVLLVPLAEPVVVVETNRPAAVEPRP